MKLRRLLIKNFRSLVNIDIPIKDTTILIGENNVGKTALLDALKIVLNWNKNQTTHFKEYDYHMATADDSPDTCEGIIIELWFKEDKPNEWSSSLKQDLNSILQVDPNKSLISIGLRINSEYDLVNGENSTWNFLTIDGEPLTGRGNSKNNIKKFLSYIKIFYLQSMRNSAIEFSPNSKFWGSILKDLKITEENSEKLTKELAELNKSLLSEDKRLEEVMEILDGGNDVMIGMGHETSVKALPLKPWDLLSKSEIFIKSQGNDVDFPLSIHGQGIQSLEVIFLFQAYIKVLLKPTFKQETEAIITLEEPETHLHPQAVRALASHLNKIDSQKIISTHSPYFIQKIPFEDIFMLRKEGAKSKVLYLKDSFEVKVSESQEIIDFCKNKENFEYDISQSTLSLTGTISDKDYRKLIRILPEEEALEITQLKQDSQFYLNDNEISKLYNYAKRARGEILFANAWILCEGQSDYVITNYFADLLNKPLDPLGITVIDFQNNGSLSTFIKLAENFEIPWVMFCDNDSGGQTFIKTCKNLGFNENQIGTDDKIGLINRLPMKNENLDLELFLVKNGFSDEYYEIIEENKSEGCTVNKNKGETGFEDEVASCLRKLKPEHAIYLVEKLKKSNADKTRVPQFFSDLIDYIIERIDLNE